VKTFTPFAGNQLLQHLHCHQVVVITTLMSIGSTNKFR